MLYIWIYDLSLRENFIKNHFLSVMIYIKRHIGTNRFFAI